MLEIKGKYNTAKVMIDNIDETTYNQIQTFVNHPEFKGNIVIMPDTHAGKGSVIGFTMPLGDKICPNIVGVDIGCGMLSVKIVDVKQSLEDINIGIRKIIPLGFNINNNDKNYSEIQGLKELCLKIGAEYEKVKCGISSLGGGNHFIELGKDEQNNIWLTVHTGSRNLGKRVCDYWQDIAKKENIEEHNNKIKHILEISKPEDRQKLISENKLLYQNEIFFLSKENTKLYIEDMNIAQQYADLNRHKIISNICLYFNWQTHDMIHSVHNYINFTDKIIRKGAISSYKENRIIIPFNMRDGILICEGKSNIDWNNSAPHGAGRISSRGDAKKKFTLDEFKETMQGIYSTSVNLETLDESPMAYKNCKIIEEAIEPTAKIINRIKPILNIKA